MRLTIYVLLILLGVGYILYDTLYSKAELDAFGFMIYFITITLIVYFIIDIKNIFKE